MEPCPCPWHSKPKAPQYALNLSKGNNMTDIYENPYYGNVEFEKVYQRAMLRHESVAPSAEPVEKSEAVSREELAEVVQALVEIVRSQKEQAPPVINVEVTPEISLKPHSETRKIVRDERGRIQEIESKIT